MKKFYFLLAILLFSLYNSQIINISDANLKLRLLSAGIGFNVAYNSADQTIAIDTNSDGEIQFNEAQLVYKLNLDSTNIVDIQDLQYFPNLQSVSIGFNPITAINLQPFPNLKSFSSSSSALTSANFTNNTLENLDVTIPQLTNIDLQGCPNLTDLTFYNINSNLTTLDLSNKINLQNLWLTFSNTFANNFQTLNTQGTNHLLNVNITGSKQPTLDLSNQTQLQTLYFKQGAISSININNCPNIVTLNLENNALTAIDLSLKPNLQSVYLKNNNLSSLNLNNLTSLRTIDATNNVINGFSMLNNVLLESVLLINNQLSTINLTGAPNMIGLYVSQNPLNTIDTSMLPELRSLHIATTEISTLNINNNPKMLNLNFYDNPFLTNFLAKTGGYLNFGAINYQNNPNLKYICANSNHINQFISKNQTYGYNNIQINTYCSFTPGGTSYTIQGNTKYDINSNGCDVTDPKKAFQKFNITNGSVSGSVISSSSGEYSIPVQAGSYTITPVLENPTYYNISPASFTANFPTQTSPLDQNFCLTANGNHNDLEIVIIPINAAIPGFVSEYKVLFKNKGTAIQAGSLSFNYDDNKMNLLSTSLATSSQSFGVLNYQFTNLLPFQTRQLTLKFTLNMPTATPPLNGNDILNYTAQINGLTDETPLDNAFTLNQTVVNSLDPNDKICLEGTQITQTKVGDYVHYMIRFENSGTANAQNIVVKDMIDTSKFDINSLVVMSASDSFVTRITNPNTVEFIFEGIQLPFNVPYNGGYVSFKIKTRSTLVLGDSFSNTANIYFDYNAPIVTNTATTTVANILGTSEISSGKDQMEFYPNPVENVINFKGKDSVIKIEIYDASGRIVLSRGVKNNETNISELTTGNYFLKIYTKDQYYINKILKK